MRQRRVTLQISDDTAPTNPDTLDDDADMPDDNSSPTIVVTGGSSNNGRSGSIVNTSNSSGLGSSNVSSISSRSFSPIGYLRRHRYFRPRLLRPTTDQASSTAAAVNNAEQVTNAAVASFAEPHVHAGSVRYGKQEVVRNRWGEAEEFLNRKKSSHNQEHKITWWSSNTGYNNKKSYFPTLSVDDSTELHTLTLRNNNSNVASAGEDSAAATITTDAAACDNTVNAVTLCKLSVPLLINLFFLLRVASKCPTLSLLRSFVLHFKFIQSCL